MKDIIQGIKNESHNLMQSRKVVNPFDDELSKERFETLKEKGIVIIKDYYTLEQCEVVKNEIDRLVEKFKNKIWVDEYDSDHRVHGADRLSEPIGAFFNDPYLGKFTKAYYENTPDFHGFTLAARLEYKKDNPGSGGGWHRDAAAKKTFKAIIYLTDTSEKNGPFQYLMNSHKPTDVLYKQLRFNLEVNQGRFSDETMEPILKANVERLVTATATAGTVILVDTRGLHRGMPIQEGKRYALTNYYSKRPVNKKFTKKFMEEDVNG